MPKWSLSVRSSAFARPASGRYAVCQSCHAVGGWEHGDNLNPIDCETSNLDGKTPFSRFVAAECLVCESAGFVCPQTPDRSLVCVIPEGRFLKEWIEVESHLYPAGYSQYCFDQFQLKEDHKTRRRVYKAQLSLNSVFDEENPTPDDVPSVPEKINE